MQTVNKLMPQGRGLAPVLLKRAATLELDWDVRQKSRFDTTDSAGRALGVFLPRGTVLRGGDVLVTEDGSLVVVHAAPQPVLVVRHCPAHGAPSDLARAAYHLGNRHVAVEVRSDHLKCEPDHVLAAMLGRMHLLVSEAVLPFEPEGGAYQGAPAGAGHGHDRHGGHAHPHPHAPGHRHDGHDHGHDRGHGHGHDHGPSHDHAHDHAPAGDRAHDHSHHATPPR